MYTSQYFIRRVSMTAMPKDTQSLSRRIKRLISEFGKNAFSTDLIKKLSEVKRNPKRRSRIT